MALLYSSEIKSDPRLSLEAFRAKDRVLNKFRTCLDIYMKKKEVGLLRILCTTALVLASLEYVINRSWKDASRNLVGIGALLESTGPEVLDQLDDVKEYFSCYRVLQAPFAFFFRQKTFLGQPEWIGRLWQPHCSSQPQFFQALLDIAYLVPSEAELYDSTQSRSLGILVAQFERLRSIGVNMDQWEVDYLAAHPEGLYITVPSTWGTPFDLSFQYNTPEQAASYISFLGFRLTVFNLVTQITADLSREHDIEKGIESSASGVARILTQICQSMEYFLPRGNKIVGIITALYPFDLAWRIFLEMSRKGMWLEEELVWCEMAAQRIEKAGLFIFTDWTRNKVS